MYQLVAVVCSVNVFDNGDFSNSERVEVIMLYVVADGNADGAPSKSPNSVWPNIYISGSSSSILWYLQTSNARSWP